MIMGYITSAYPPRPAPTICPVSSPRIMGEFAISTSMTVFVWFISVGIIGVNLYIVGGFLVDLDTSQNQWIYAAAAIAGVFYLSFLGFLMRQDLLRLIDRVGAFFSKLGVGDMSDIAHLQYHAPPESSDLLPGPSGAGRHRMLPSEDSGSEGATEDGRADGGGFSEPGEDCKSSGR